MPKKRWGQQGETTCQPGETGTQLTRDGNHQPAQAEKLSGEKQMGGEIKTRELMLGCGIKQCLGECQTTNQQRLLQEPKDPRRQKTDGSVILKIGVDIPVVRRVPVQHLSGMGNLGPNPQVIGFLVP